MLKAWIETVFTILPTFNIKKIRLIVHIWLLLSENKGAKVKKRVLRPGKEAHVYDLKTWEAEAGRSQVGGQPGLRN